MATFLHVVIYSIQAVDDLGLSSPELDVTIVYCSQCNGHGTCDFELVREQSYDNFKYAVCNCTENWEGE